MPFLNDRPDGHQDVKRERFVRLCLQLPLFIAFSLAPTLLLQLSSHGQIAATHAELLTGSRILTSRAPDLPHNPELALDTFHELRARQEQLLAAYTANATFQAFLLSTSQNAELEVLRHYVAPRTLQFTQTRFGGDPFVKRNVIARFLQSEVDHVAKQEQGKLAITPENYVFRYKRVDLLDGRYVHVYGVKPRRKIPGLFRGEIYLDSYSGSLLRVKGRLVKSPSFFIRHVEFVQDYADFDGFTMPVRLHSVIAARVLGKVILDVSTQDYSVSAEAEATRVAAVLDRQ